MKFLRGLLQRNSKTSDVVAPKPEPTASNDIVTAVKGGGVSFAGRVFEYVIRFLFGILIARVLGVEQYGLYVLGITVSLMASNMAMLGLQTGMVRFLPPAIREKDEETIWGIIQICLGLPLIFSVMLAAGCYLFAGPMADILFQDVRMADVIRLVCLLIPLDTISSMAYVLTISYKQPKYSVIASNIVSPLLKLFLAAGFLALGYSLKGVLISQAIATLVAVSILLYFANTLFSLWRRLGKIGQLVWPLLRYSTPVHLGWMVNTFRSSLSTLVLGFMGLTTGVGVYTAASRFSLLGSMFYLSIGNISTPILADLHSRHLTGQLKAYYQTTTRWMMMFNLPVFLTSLIFAEPLLEIFGDDFTAGAASMMVLAFGTLVYTSTGVGANILDMTDHPRVNTANSVVMLILTIVFNATLVPLWGVVGAAVASAGSTVLVNLISLIEVWFLARMQPYNQTFVKPLVAALAAALAGYVVDYSLALPFLPRLLIGGGTLWLVYMGVLFILRLTPEDQALVNRVLSRFRSKLAFSHPSVK